MALPNPNQTKLDSEQLKALAALANIKARRKQSEFVFLGLPLYSIAFGPDFAKGELRGHAKGVFAFGDIATGVFAFGGVAMGGVAFGGLALGLITFGGLSVGLFLALGGAAIGTIACGGGALGVVAVGGAAAGYYAAGGAAYGAYVLDAMRQSPEAIEFFSQWNFLQLFGVPQLRR
ncbi:MAG TPA: hypothetical protein VEN29_13705 [Casimicrobiaceae bacterium]|nr:hypothetical protein [Casimicrobiaceae bacterium]